LNLEVQNWFQGFAFKWVNLYRYDEDSKVTSALPSYANLVAVGLCALHSFDPYPITYSLSNP
jgi:hypothetical protein